MFRSAPGYQYFEAFCAEAGLDPYSEDAATIEACPAGIVSDDEDSDDEDSDDEDSDDDEVETDHIKTNIPKEWGGKKVSFNMEKDQPKPASGSVTTEKQLERDLPNITNFDLLDGPNTLTEGVVTPNIIHGEDDQQPTTDIAHLLWYHQ
eukprot:scaffold33947_cov76-Attheya_sp.AAC.3